MAVYLKNNAVGVDSVINDIIAQLSSVLNIEKSWGVNIYHRIYKEHRKEGVFPYAFLSGKEYLPVFNNDRVNGEIGFVLDDNRNTNNGTNTVDCDVVFSVNIEKILGTSNIREDERLIIAARQALSVYHPTELKTRIKNVYSEFNTDKILYTDMQPLLNFSYKIKLVYTENCIL